MKSDITLWDFVTVARRQWRWMLFGFGATLALAIAATLLMDPKYRSEALLLVRLGRENLGVEPIAGLADKAGVNLVDTRENEINSMSNVIKSRALAEQVVDRVTPEAILQGENSLKDRVLGLVGGRLFPYYNLSQRDQAIHTLQSKMRIKALEKSSVIRLTFDAPDPRLAQRIVSAMVDTYLAHHSQIHRTAGSLVFLEQEWETTRDELLKREEELRKLKSCTGLVAPADQRAALVARISQLRSNVMEAQANRDAIQKELETLNRSLQSMPETEMASQMTGAGNSAVDSMRAKLFDLQTQLNELLAKYTEEHIRVQQMREAIASAEAILQREEHSRQETTTGRSKSFDETQLTVVRKRAELDALATKTDSLNALIASEESRLDELNTVDLQIEQLAREIAILNANYQKYSSDVERARLDVDLETKSLTNVSVAQAATLNFMPVFPIVPLNVAIGGVVGVFVGGLLALLIEIRRQRRLASVPDADFGTSNGDVSNRLSPVLDSEEAAPEFAIRNPR